MPPHRLRVSWDAQLPLADTTLWSGRNADAQGAVCMAGPRLELGHHDFQEWMTLPKRRRQAVSWTGGPSRNCSRNLSGRPVGVDRLERRREHLGFSAAAPREEEMVPPGPVKVSAKSAASASAAAPCPPRQGAAGSARFCVRWLSQLVDGQPRSSPDRPTAPACSKERAGPQGRAGAAAPRPASRGPLPRTSRAPG